MKRIGSLLFVFCIWFYGYLYAQTEMNVHLEVKRADGLPLQEAAIDKPFLLRVSVDAKGLIGKIYVDAPVEFELRNRGTTTQLQSVNGVATRQKVYQYVVRAKEIGTFKLGPASVTVDGKLYSSNSVDISVVQEPVERVTLSEPRLELVLPKGPFVIGQTIPFSIRFYHLGVSQLNSAIPPKIEGFTIGTLEGPFEGVGEIEGVSYDFVEWRTDIIADKVGSFEFEPAHAVYTMKPRDRQHIWQFLSDRFALGMRQYEVYSNSIQVTVDPLPEFKDTVHGIGNFTYIQALVNQTTATQGEGIIYTLEIGGDDAIKNLSHPPLQLPDTLSVYESKTSMPTNRYSQAHQQRKSFEYVIQAHEPGEIIIPAQSFVFYDPNAHRFKKLETDPVTLTIKSNSQTQQNKLADTPEKEQEHSDEGEPEDQESHLPLYAQGSAEHRVDSGIKSSLFWTVLVLLLSGLLVQWSIFFLREYQMRNSTFLRARTAFQRAKKRLSQAGREENVKDLYTIFVDVCADRSKMNSSEMQEKDMVALLTQKKVPTETVKHWQEYIHQLQAFAFYDTALACSSDVFEQAQKWLAFLEKNL